MKDLCEIILEEAITAEACDKEHMAFYNLKLSTHIPLLFKVNIVFQVIIHIT